MSDYFFFSTKITQKQVEEIIRTAGYDPTDYNYQPLLENKGFLVTGDVPMAESKLKFAAKKLDITVEIRAGANDAGPVQLSSAAALAGTVYTVDFINSTPDTWTLGVYQTLPASPGLTSVSWKQTTVPRSGESGVQWTVDYLVGIANYSQVGGKGVYKASQKLATNLGQRWAARFEGGAQQLFPNGSANPGQVVIDNEFGRLRQSRHRHGRRYRSDSEGRLLGQ